MTTRTNNQPMFGETDGPLLIGAARESIANYLETSKIAVPAKLQRDSRFEQKLGCFVTLKGTEQEESLRGCIGFPEPIYRLAEALPTSAVLAATRDPRFPPIAASELENLVLEVSILTKPELINVASKDELLSNIRVGIDGLVMKWTYGSGLLLPQVAEEYKWTSREFLENLSMKAGASSDEWQKDGTTIYRFQAHVFQETTPHGQVLLSMNGSKM